MVLLPDSSVCDCYCSLGLYSADLVEQWNCLNLRHMSGVRDIVPSGRFSDLTFKERTEVDVKQVITLFLLL